MPTVVHRRSLPFALPLLVAAAPALAQRGRESPPAAPPAVHEVRDLPYHEGPDADPHKHRLDLFLPAGATKAPVVMWIHGGGWRLGDRWWYASVGRRFAEEGVGFAAISYRLTPQVRHPGHVEDCARAFAWLKRNVARHGGDPQRLFVSGQSAGGHLSALLALDPRYLRAHGLQLDVIAGAMPMSGVYEIPARPEGTSWPLGMFAAAFGSDPEACREASPVAHVGNLACPMLVVTETELAAWLRRSTDALRAAAKEAGVDGIRFVDAEHRNHLSIVVQLAAKEDAVRQALVGFVRQRCRELDAEQAKANVRTKARR
jgi:acetyl esterase/lipase